ncbi:MAG: SH3 domain-containing protein, partial [Rudaea sp.]
NQWFEIEWPPGSGQVAWISADIVVPESSTDALGVGYTSPAPPPGSIYGRITLRTRFRSGPGKDYDTLDRLAAGARVTILAKSDDGEWFQIVDPRDSTKTAWVAARDQEDTLVELLGTADQLAIAAAPPTPTPGPTPVPRPTRTPGPPGTVAGGRILMSSNRGGSYAIYTIGENGAVGRVLSPFGDSYGARWSPDGGRIVFYHTVSTSPVHTSHIFAMNADGKAAVDLSAVSGGGSDTDPDWSPDGRQIVFVRTPRASGPEIWVMNANGSGARKIVALSPATGIADPGASDFSPHPRWSPDGGRIAYAAVPRTRNPGAPLYPNIFVASASGGNETQLTDNDMINANPVWSADGKQVAWSAKDLFSRQNWRVWAMSASGGNQRMLISSVGGDGNSGVQAVEWIGNRLLLAGWVGSWNVYLANGDGSGLAAVTSDAADDRPGDWLP